MDEREYEYYKQLEVLRVLMMASYEDWLNNAKAYEDCLRRFTVCGFKRYLDGRELQKAEDAD
jgi:hypothetical protein